jgi:hypothetical protein
MPVPRLPNEFASLLNFAPEIAFQTYQKAAAMPKRRYMVRASDNRRYSV